jgi:hypothetical protein
MMKKSLENGWNSFLKLFRLLAWYGVAIATLLYLLPIVALLTDMQYDLVSSSAKFLAAIGSVVVISAWHIMNTRERLMASA